MPSLRDLDAQFIKLGDARGSYQRGVSFAEAQGVIFLCPLCFKNNRGPIGTHSVICWSRSRGVPDDIGPKPGRWTLAGTSIDDLTLDGDPPGNARSVLLTGPGCAWHGFVNNGVAE